jgi:hypothetical protein
MCADLGNYRVEELKEPMTGKVELRIEILYTSWDELRAKGITDSIPDLNNPDTYYNVRGKTESIGMVLNEARARLAKIIPENAGCTWFIADKESYS